MSLILVVATYTGTSFSPLSQMILGPTLYDLPDYIPTYKPSRDLDQYDTPITPIPFDTSPLILPSLIRESLPISLDAVDVEDPIVDEPEWKQLDCVPMYFPMYVARYKNDKRGQDFTIVMEAGNSKVCRCWTLFRSYRPCEDTNERGLTIFVLSLFNFSLLSRSRATTRSTTPPSHLS